MNYFFNDDCTMHAKLWSGAVESLVKIMNLDDLKFPILFTLESPIFMKLPSYLIIFFGKWQPNRYKVVRCCALDTVVLGVILNWITTNGMKFED